MDFIDEIRTRSARFSTRVEYWKGETPTEEATKTSLVLPFIQALGYDIFDPTEVVPEYTADIGLKKGEKVDYAIMQRGRPIILIECKKHGSNLAKEAISQLVRYFGVTEAHFGILTNGINYRFFSDLDQPNVMDPKPFFEFNMSNFTVKAVEELKRFTKDEFNVDETLEAASVLKYIEGMKQVLIVQLSVPDEEFSRWLTKQVYSKPLTQAARERFSQLVRQALREFIDDRIDATLKSALARDTVVDEPTPEDASPKQTPFETDAIVTTEEEVEGYELVKSIVSDVVNSDRVHIRDAKSYCAIVLDNKNRQPIVRFHFDRSTKTIGLFDGTRYSRSNSLIETSKVIESLDDIYQHADQLKDTVRRYLNPPGDNLPAAPVTDDWT